MTSLLANLSDFFAKLLSFFTKQVELRNTPEMQKNDIAKKSQKYSDACDKIIDRRDIEAIRKNLGQ